MEKGPPRRPTPEETRGDNNAAVEYAMLLFSLRSWMPLFEHDLEGMNRGKVGRPYDWLADSIKGFPHGEVMAVKFRDAGFTEVRFHNKMFGACCIYEGSKPR